MSLKEKMTVIADAIRLKIGGNEPLTLDGIEAAIPDIYDKGVLAGRRQGQSEGYETGYTIGHYEGEKEGFNDGYESGYTSGKSAGYEEGYSGGVSQGQREEYDAFWDTFQQNGNRTNYNRAFFSETMAQSGWNDENYNPKYDIVTTSGAQTFWCALITDTKVPITLKDGCNANTMFGSCTKLVAIPKLILEGTVSSWANAFITCNALEEIEFEGVIDNNIDFSPCQKLAYKSLMNIIEHLKDFSDTTTTRTLTLGTENLAKLTDTEKASATQKGWTLA